MKGHTVGSSKDGYITCFYPPTEGERTKGTTHGNAFQCDFNVRGQTTLDSKGLQSLDSVNGKVHSEVFSYLAGLLVVRHSAAPWQLQKKLC